MSKSISNSVIRKVANGYIIETLSCTHVVEGSDKELLDYLTKATFRVVADGLNNNNDSLNLTIEIDFDK